MITELTRRDLIDLFNAYDPDPVETTFASFGVTTPPRHGVEWWGRLGEIEFLDRLYDLDALTSTERRFSTAREEICQHRLNNPEDWPDDWIFSDSRFELDTSDERLLAFLAETLHPSVRPDKIQVEKLRDAYNRLLRRDQAEILESGSISGHPVFIGGPAVPRNVQPGTLCDAIGQAIRSALSANAVPAFCDELRFPSLPANSYANPMSSKAAYVVERLKDVTMAELVSFARLVLDRHRDDDLADLVFELDLAARPGVQGAPKNLIFAANGPKPDLILVDSVNNDIQIVKNAEYCLVYDRPIDADRGLSFEMLVEWWASEYEASDIRTAANSLYSRLQAALNGAEAALMAGYKRLLQRYGFRLPALVPQVYLHFDPKSVRQRLAKDGKKLERQRMDFLLLLPGRQRVVIELDGVEHYAKSGDANPALYAAMMREDRRLRLIGYEIYRFGGDEFADHEVGRSLSEAFFTQLLYRYNILS